MKERYHVTGMSCSACSSHVEKAVNKLENVEKASVNLLTETMDVTYDETKITSAEIIDAVVKAGYGASVMTEVLLSCWLYMNSASFIRSILRLLQ